MWRNWQVVSAPDIDERLHNFKILFAYNSGKIENEAITYHDTREIFENGRALNFTGDPRALFEQRNQKTCYELLKPKIAAREPLGVQLVLETHEVLTAGTYDEDKAVYYSALEAYDRKEDITPMFDFLRMETERTWEKTLNRTQS